MPSRPRTPLPDHLLTRRGLLAGVAGTGLGLGGCTFADPTVKPSPRARAATSATPTPSAAMVAAHQQEQAMATWLAGLPLVGAAGTVPAELVPVLASIRDGHRAHAAVLGTPDPLSPGAPSPLAEPAAAKVAGTWAEVSAQLASRETALATAHRTAAMAATAPDEALLHASLMAFAHAATTPGLVPVRTAALPAHVTVGTRTEALGVLLEALRALADGLQSGSGQLPSGSSRYAPARARLDAVWTQRDRTEAALVAAKATVPPARPAYRMPGTFTSEAAVLATWGALETSVLDAWARVAAASTGADRASALDAMAAQTAAVTATGTALGWWPGWA